MSNQTVTNKQPSNLDLSPLRDLSGQVISLRPKGSKGDSCEVSQETADHEVMQRVKKAGWVGIAPVGAPAPAAAPPPPAPSKPAAAAPPPPAPSPSPAAAAPLPPPPAPPAPPESTQVMPPAEVEKLVEQSKAEEPAAPVETPPDGDRPAKVGRVRNK